MELILNDRLCRLLGLGERLARMSVREIKDIWRFASNGTPPCACCGDECDFGEDLFFLDQNDDMVAVCDHCSMTIMNVTNYARSGRYITWPNEPIERPAYTKRPIAKETRWEVWGRDNFTCKHCGSRKNLALDHIHPEVEGGSNNLENLQTLCHSCNSKKGRKIPLARHE